VPLGERQPLRDECLNEHWFTSLVNARALIEAWRRDYNEQRPKKDLGGLPPDHVEVEPRDNLIR